MICLKNYNSDTLVYESCLLETYITLGQFPRELVTCFPINKRYEMHYLQGKSFPV